MRYRLNISGRGSETIEADDAAGACAVAGKKYPLLRMEPGSRGCSYGQLLDGTLVALVPDGTNPVTPWSLPR